MESWILWVMLGLYPMTGQTTFLIGSPWFSNLTVALGRGRSLRITTAAAVKCAADPSSCYYVQSLKVNSQPWNRSWVSWDDVFAAGGTMDYLLGPEPANWTTGPLPPSPASEEVPLSPAASDDSIRRTPSAVMMANLVLSSVIAFASAVNVYLVIYWRRRAEKAEEQQGYAWSRRWCANGPSRPNSNTDDGKSGITEESDDG